MMGMNHSGLNPQQCLSLRDPQEYQYAQRLSAFRRGGGDNRYATQVDNLRTLRVRIIDKIIQHVFPPYAIYLAICGQESL